jgi:hypothetical protein
MTSPGAPERPCCTVGRRDDVADIDATLRSGTPGALSAVAKRTGISKSSLSKHANGCLKRQRTQENESGTDANGAVTVERKLAEAKPILARSEKLERRAWRLLKQVEAGDQLVDYKAAAALLGKIKDALTLQAQVAGEIKAAATTVNVYNSPDWHRLRDLLVEALAEHPEAMQAVIGVLEREQGNGAALH